MFKNIKNKNKNSIVRSIDYTIHIIMNKFIVFKF